MAQTKQQLKYNVTGKLSNGALVNDAFETSIFGEGSPNQQSYATGLAQGGISGAEWDESLGGYVKRYGDGGYKVYTPSGGYEKTQQTITGPGYKSYQYLGAGESPTLNNIDSAGQRADRLSDPNASDFTKRVVANNNIGGSKISPSDYYYDSTKESIAQYNARIAALRGQTGSIPNSVGTTSGGASGGSQGGSGGYPTYPTGGSFGGYNPSTNNTNPYLEQLKALQGLSPEEQAAQKAIDDQNNAMRAGVQNVQDQPIGMSFISGQQASLENRNVNLQIPLQQKLANAQAKRMASLDSAKTQLDQFNIDRSRSDSLASAQQLRADSLAQQKADDAYRTSQAKQAQSNADRAFNASASSSSGGSAGSGGAQSAKTSKVLDGFVSLSDLTTSERSKVTNDLYAKGFGSDTPPSWFRDYIEKELRMNLTTSALKQEWTKYRDDVLGTSKTSSSGGIDYDSL